MRYESTPEQFFARLVPADGGCRDWPGQLYRGGYGKTSYHHRTIGAHRLAWLFAYGPVPDGMSVLHRCDRRKCCEPAHLFLGTHQENMTDMVTKGRAGYGDAKRHTGSKHGRAKLTEADIEPIRQAVANGAKYRDLAVQYGVSYGLVGHVIQGRIWTHVESH